MKTKIGLSAALVASLTLTGHSASAGSSEVGAFAVGAAVGALVNQSVNNNRRQQEAAQQQQRQRANANSYTRQQNRETQAALNAFGFNAGVVDGALGSRSRAAISNYQAYMGYPATGYLQPYERSTLVSGHQRLNAGGGAAYPNVVANEGTQGLLKAFADPNYASKYSPNQNTTVQAAAPSQNTVDAPAPTTPVAASASLAPLDLTATTPSESMVRFCDTVDSQSRANNGKVLASNVVDADQALGEQFCEARDYSIDQLNALMTAANLDDAQIVQACGTISENMAAVTSVVDQRSVDDIAISGRSIVNKLANGDMDTAAGYGQLCLGIGYREDNADMALAASVVMLSTGQMPYAEFIGHHLRWGFGTAEAPIEAAAWYNTATDALANGATPAVLPAKSQERMAIINAAVNAPSSAQQPVKTSGSLPALNLSNN